MNNKLIRILIIGIGILGCISFVGYTLLPFMSDCGMDDGPFEAVLIEPIIISESAQKFELSNNAILLIENRTDSLSPILILKQNGKVKWTLDTDTRNTKGYEYTRIWNIRNVEILNNSNPIKFQFFADWTYGVESGSMKIDWESGENSFCLSW